jgi:hypothetical protein
MNTLKTTSDLFLAFTNKTPAFQYGPNETFNNAKVYDISPKQYNWLSNLIWKQIDAASGDKTGIVSAQQYSENINGFSYSIIGKKKLRIRVWQLPN